MNGLVGGLVAINFIFPYTGNVIIPIDEVIFFRGVAINHQPDGTAPASNGGYGDITGMGYVHLI